MSHFSATLNQILNTKPKLDSQTWAEKFDVYPAHLAMMASGGGVLGHRVIAKIAGHLSKTDREKLIASYFIDECDSIEKEAAAVSNAKPEWNLSAMFSRMSGNA